MLHPFIHHHPSPNISFHHHSSHCRKGWVKMGWTNEFRLMSSEENNKLWQMWINHLTANADDWIWKIHDFLGRNPATLQRKRWYHLSARFDKCKTAKPANPYIYRMCTNTDKSLRAYTDFIFDFDDQIVSKLLIKSISWRRWLSDA